MSQSGRLVPARLQAALALLERVRDHPSLKLSDHMSAGSSGLGSHESFGARAHSRHNLQPLNKNHGRRSSNLSDWGQPLLDVLRVASFEGERESLLDSMQLHFVTALRTLLDTEPLTVRVRGRSAEAIIADILDQADERGKAGAVAQYLVGAKLQLRFKDASIPLHPYNKGDRTRYNDALARLADFEFGPTAIEVALGTPDEKHLQQVESALEDADIEFWLLVRNRRLAAWQSEVESFENGVRQRVVVAAVEAFVGQNISELGRFSPKGKHEQLVSLFDLYNNKWIAALGPPSLRIITK